MQVVSQRERSLALLFASSLGFLLGFGFIPTAQHFYELLSPFLPQTGVLLSDLIAKAAFPLLAGIFWFSLPRRKMSGMSSQSLASLFWTFPLPCLIALIFGWSHLGQGLLQTGITTDTLLSLYWYVLLIPIGEEWLFRGWVYSIAEWLWPQKYFTFTNPFPTSLWVSAIAFSLWHIQNISQDSWPLVLFQVAYTLMVGIWLGHLRWQSGTLWLPILAHLLINLGAALL